MASVRLATSLALGASLFAYAVACGQSSSGPAADGGGDDSATGHDGGPSGDAGGSSSSGGDSSGGDADSGQPMPPMSCATPLPPPKGMTVNVSTEADLQKAVQNLQSGQTIVVAAGTYKLSASLYIGNNAHLTDVGIRGATNDAGDVKLVGAGMDDMSITMGISIWNAQRVTIANLTVSGVYFDDIELKGDQGCDAITIFNCALLDSGEQIIKGDPDTTQAIATGVTNSSVQCCTIGYTTAPSTTDHGGGTGYTNGVDIHAGKGWTVANNVFQNFHTPDSSQNLWNPVVLFWHNSLDNTVVANTFINVDRAIAFGLGPPAAGDDNTGGLIANNFVTMPPGEFSAQRQMGADAPIIAWDSPGTMIAFNTVLVNANAPNSVQFRFAQTINAAADGNLSDAPIRSRDGAIYADVQNYVSATPAMFVAPAKGDLHIVTNAATMANVIGKATPIAVVPDNFDGKPRTNPTDIGAD